MNLIKSKEKYYWLKEKDYYICLFRAREENQRKYIMYYNQKKNKKEEIEESMFRYKKIKKFDYQGLIKRKLKEDTYISPAYHLGEGFQET